MGKLAPVIRNLKKLWLENCNNTKDCGYRTQRLFESQFYDMAGIRDNVHGEPQFTDTNRRCIDIQEVQNLQFGELAKEWFGGNPSDVYCGQKKALMGESIMEGGGHSVGPSEQALINGYDASVFGLVNMLVLAAWGDIQWVGDSLVTLRPSTTEGGSMVRPENDSGLPANQDLAADEPAPVYGLSQRKVARPLPKRKARAIQLNELTMLYDLTGYVQETAKGVGEAVRYDRELVQLRTVLGIDNSFTITGPDGVVHTNVNTYQVSAGSAPINHLNTWTNDIASYTDIQDARFILTKQTNPYTNRPVPITSPTIICTEGIVATVRALVAQTTIRVATGSDLTNVHYSPDPIAVTMPIANVVSSPLIYKILVENSPNGADSDFHKKRWFYGQFPSTFFYENQIPFRTRSAPITFDEMRRGIVFNFLADERGAVGVENPFYVGRQIKPTDANATG
jgi:hypothetical protein